MAKRIHLLVEVSSKDDIPNPFEWVKEFDKFLVDKVSNEYVKLEVIQASLND